MPTLEEYEAARKLVADYKQCSGCHQLFTTAETTETIQYGQVKHWCALCYQSVKDDW